MRRLMAWLMAACLLCAPALAEEKHYYEYRRNAGDCGTLTGDVCLMVVFVSTDEGQWTEEEKNAFFDAWREAEAVCLQAAVERNVTLNMTGRYFDVTVPAGMKEFEQYDYIMQECLWVEDMGEAHGVYEESLQCDDTPFIIALHGEGRGYTYVVNPASESNRDCDEYVVVYSGAANLKRSIMHELLHLYGAVDYYFPELIEEPAKRLFPDSIMGREGFVVDDFTAYLIGWTDEPSLAAQEFMEATIEMNAEISSAALAVEWPELYE